MSNLYEISKFILEKTQENGEIFGDRLPTSTKEGKYNFAEDGNWVGGFWTGLNYLCYEMSGKPGYLDAARKSRHRFTKRLYENIDSLDHDIGFLYILSSVADYKITGCKEARKIALNAAEVLAKRFNEKGKFIQAWNVWNPDNPFSQENRGRIIIDCMYNMPLLFWASEETGNRNYYEIADAHTDTCGKYIVRPDYTTYHTYVFNPDTGEPKYGRTHQGFAHESCWSRGQSWAVGGFAYAYGYTGNKRYLEIAKNCAHVFIDSLEEDHVPMWDFSLPNKAGEPRDTSAGAIAAEGMLEISRHVPKGEKEYYIDQAAKIIHSLYNNYSTRTVSEEQGLLLQGCGNRPKNPNTCSLIYGDYYFAEAVGRLMGNVKIYW